AKLVIIEGVILAFTGAIIGAPLGLFWVKCLVSWPAFREVLNAGVVVDRPGMLLGVGGSILTALAASVLPAVSAMRVSPLEAMNPLASAPKSRVPVRLTICGALLTSIDPILMWTPWFPRTVKFYGHFAIGLP